MIVARRYAGAAREAGANPALPRNCKRGHSGRPLGVIFQRRPGKDERRRWTFEVLTRKPGDRREPYPETPFACEGGHMVRFLVVFFVVFFLLCVPAVLAGELQIKVLDPHSAAVAGAQVSVYRAAESAPLQVRISSGDGIATFSLENSTPLRVEVLAPGFAVARTEVQPSSSAATVKLQVASASEMVIVTATRSPAPEQETASSVSLLTGEEITTMQPVAFADALRFLPGAVVNVAGQRGGLGSLFVRGGDSRYNKVLVDGVPVNEPGGTFDFGSVPLAEADRVEFQRGSQSTLYGSDAMTSVVQIFTRNGTSAVPELRFGADGGNFGTAHGFVSVAGARSRFDYNGFADHFYTNGQGPNANYWNDLQGGNVGVQIS